MGRLSTSPYPSSWAHDQFDPDPHHAHLHQPCQKLSTSSPPSKVKSLSIGELGINLGLSMELEMDTTTPPSLALEGAAGRPPSLEAAIEGFNSSFVDFLGDEVHVGVGARPVVPKLEEPEEVRAMELLGDGLLLDHLKQESEEEDEDDGLAWAHAGNVDEVEEEMDDDETSESEDSGGEAVPTPFDWSMHYTQQPHGIMHPSPNLRLSFLPSPKPVSTSLPTPEVYYPPSQLHHNYPSLSSASTLEPHLATEPVAATPLFFPSLCPTPFTSTQRADSPPFIPPLSRPRGAHLSQRYKNESDLDLLSDEEDYSIDIVPVQEYPSSDDETSERAGSTSTTSSMGSGASAGQRPLKRPRAKSLKKRLGSVSSESSSVGVAGGGAAGGNVQGLRRTEVPAVEDDPSIKPYGCFLCWTRAIEEREPLCLVAGKGKGKARARVEESEGVEVEWGEEGPPATYRTVRELREHCGAHKRARQAMSETPFRCSLDPCGKLFKSAAGLLWHFTHASSGHFFVSMEEGEDRPTKKFKKVVQASGRTERCPVAGCTKAFKQTAGLAYHLAHAPKHPECVTEAMVSAFTPKLVSKTRWWFAKCGLTIRAGGAVGTGGKGGGVAAGTNGGVRVKKEDLSDSEEYGEE